MTAENNNGWLPLRALRFSKDNKCFFMVLRAFIYSAGFRLGLLILKPKRMKKNWGLEGVESSEDEPVGEASYVEKTAKCVSLVCNNTKWESKCLVRALTAQKLLKKKDISSTLYLGVRQDETGKPLAHAWLRWGNHLVTGAVENLTLYAIVDRFAVLTSANKH